MLRAIYDIKSVKSLFANKSQIAIEFLLLMGMGIILTIVILLVVSSLSESKTNERTYYELNDYGISLQQELLLASELENGYMRYINVPLTINGFTFNITSGQNSVYNSYFNIEYQNFDLYFVIPNINGTLKKGLNVLHKYNDTIHIE